MEHNIKLSTALFIILLWLILLLVPALIPSIRRRYVRVFGLKSKMMWALVAITAILFSITYRYCECVSRGSISGTIISPSEFAELQEAAKLGDPRSQEMLGRLYEHGGSVHQDYLEAAKWFRKAAEQGDTAVLITLGNMYEEGKGVKRDYAEAYFWCSLAVKSSGQAFASWRGSIARHLTADQQLFVDLRVREWQKAHPSIKWLDKSDAH